jgi:hypothetical protein
LLFSLIPNFFSAAGNFFSLVSASKTLNFFHTEETKEFLYPEGGYRDLFCPEGWALLSLGKFFVLRGDESAQRAPKDKKFLPSRSTEVPKKFPAAPKDKNDPFGQQSPT